MTVQEFVRMLASGDEPDPIEGTKSKLSEGVYKIGQRQYRVNPHEPGGVDYIVRVLENGLVRIDEQQRP